MYDGIIFFNWDGFTPTNASNVSWWCEAVGQCNLLWRVHE